MKKVILVFAMLVASLPAFCQLYVGGQASAMGGKHSVTSSLIPEVGYQLTDKWAVGGQAGFSVNGLKEYDEAKMDVFALGILGAYARFTPWHNDIVYLDLKGVANFEFADYLGSFSVGVQPAVRFRIADKFDLAANLGLVGVRGGLSSTNITMSELIAAMNGESNIVGGFFLNGNNLSLSIYYNF